MEAEGRYEAKGERGRYVLMSRSPNRRKGVFPWTVLVGGVRGSEIKPGGFDLKGDAQTFAAQYDAGLCGAPAVVVQAPSPQGLPPGVYRGTAAEARRPGNPLNTYFEKVDAELQKMGFDQPGQASTMSADSTEYVSRMFDAKVDPAITAAVLVATKGHHHDHDCPGKHVELAEGAREGRREDLVFRGQRAALLDLGDGSWGYSVAGGPVVEGFVSRDAAKAAAMQALGMPAGFSMAVEEAAETKIVRRPLRSKWEREEREGVGTVWMWDGREGGYEIIDRPGMDSWVVYLDGGFVRGFGRSVKSLQDMKAWVEHYDLIGSREDAAAEEAKRKTLIWTFNGQRGHYSLKYKEPMGYMLRLNDELVRGWGPKSGMTVKDIKAWAIRFDQGLESHPEFDEGAAEESKKRLPQPDPSSGYYITHSSLTRDLWLMHEDRLVARSTDRGELLRKAEQLSESSEAAEARRPKGLRRR